MSYEIRIAGIPALGPFGKPLRYVTVFPAQEGPAADHRNDDSLSTRTHNPACKEKFRRQTEKAVTRAGGQGF
jgi:hypothetical protein